MPVPCKEQQHHQDIQQRGRHRGGGLAAGVVGPPHAHAHLDVDGFTPQQGDVEKQVDHHPQQVAHRQLQKQQDSQLQNALRHRRAVGGHGKHRNAQQEHQPALDNAGHILPPEDGIEQDEPAHPGQDQEKQVHLRPVHAAAS